MRKLVVRVSTFKQGSECENEEDITGDDLSPKEVEELAKDMMHEMIEWHYEVIEVENDEE